MGTAIYPPGVSKKCRKSPRTLILQSFFLRPEIKNYKAEADADLIPIPGQLELHGRCRCGVLLSACFCALFVADLIVGMEELELHYRRRGRSNFRKIKSGEKKTNKHKQLRGIVPEMGGGQIVYVFPLFLGKKETHKQNSQEISGKGRESPGTVPG